MAGEERWDAPRKILEEVPLPQVLVDLQKYRELAEEWGADATAIIRAQEVLVDARVRMKCRVPRCQYYGGSANCPPYTPEIGEIRETLKQYTYAVVVRHDVRPVDDFVRVKEAISPARKHYRVLHDIVSRLEAVAYTEGYYLAIAFSAGTCKFYLCDDQVCQFLDSGRCRFPERAHPSMEAMGLDVFRLVTGLGWDIYPIGFHGLDPQKVPAASTVGIVFIT